MAGTQRSPPFTAFWSHAGESVQSNVSVTTVRPRSSGASVNPQRWWAELPISAWSSCREAAARTGSQAMRAPCSNSITWLPIS